MNSAIRKLVDGIRQKAIKGAYDGVPEVRGLLQGLAFGCNDVLTYDLPQQSQWKATVALDKILMGIRELDQAYRDAEENTNEAANG